MTDENSQQQRREQERSRVSPSAGSEPSSDATPNVSSVPTPALASGKLGIEPVPNPNNDSSLTFDWRVVDLDSNRSFGCTIASRLGHRLSVEIEQGLYKRALRGTGQVQIAAIPLAVPGTRGKLVACDDETGATAEFTWQWPAAVYAQTRLSLAARVKAAFSRAPAARDPGSAQALRDAGRHPLSAAEADATDTAIDGEWQCQPYTGPPYALRISGNVGVAMLSNAPAVYAPGDIILHIDRRTANGFSGRLLYTHGQIPADRGRAFLAGHNPIHRSLRPRRRLRALRHLDAPHILTLPTRTNVNTGAAGVRSAQAAKALSKKRDMRAV